MTLSAKHLRELALCRMSSHKYVLEPVRTPSSLCRMSSHQYVLEPVRTRSDELATAGVEQFRSALCFGARPDDEQVSSRRRAAVDFFVVV